MGVVEGQPAPEAAAPPAPPSQGTFSRIHRGHARALIAGVFVVTLILLQFKSPSDHVELVASIKTLSIAVIAFYFGSRTAERKTGGN